MPAELEEWEHHIQHIHMDRLGFAWCGAKVNPRTDWLFQDIDHAAYSAPKDMVQPCPACVAAVVKSLMGEQPCPPST